MNINFSHWDRLSTAEQRGKLEILLEALNELAYWDNDPDAGSYDEQRTASVARQALVKTGFQPGKKDD